LLESIARLVGAVLVAVLTFVGLLLLADWIGWDGAARQLILGVVGLVGLAVGVVAFMLGSEALTKEVPGDTPSSPDAIDASRSIRFRAHP
jgi:hypothetical protein